MSLIAFRLDASATIGLGHLRRCLALAAKLRQGGATCHFVCNKEMGAWSALVEGEGHLLSLVDARPDQPHADAALTLRALAALPIAKWLVVDHYGLSASWHELVRPAARGLVALDDLANRPVAVDAVFDPSPCAQESAYRALTPAGCAIHVGPSYCLLRDEFSQVRAAQHWPANPPRIHLAMGGTDPGKHTIPMAGLLLDWFEQANVRVLLGSAGSQAADLEVLRRRHSQRLEVIAGSDQVAHTMAGCTVAVGAPGGTLWERFCLGLPTACVTTAATQRPVIEKLARAGWLLDLGEAAEFSQSAREPLKVWLQDEYALDKHRRFLMSQVDGKGAARVAQWMLDSV